MNLELYSDPMMLLVYELNILISEILVQLQPFYKDKESGTGRKKNERDKDLAAPCKMNTA